MPYVGGELRSLFHSEPLEVALLELANIGGDRMVEWTVINTPIGGRLVDGQGGGNLRSSWYQRPLQRTRVGTLTGWETGVATDVEYAPHVEHGTGLWGPSHSKYPIVPKKPGGFLRWIDPASGKEVFARKVMHPGSPGAHMVAIAAQMVESEFDSLPAVHAVMHEWAAATEALAD